jgi:hypothetical protein
MTQSLPDTGWIGDWSPGIGDPTVAGWITAFAYLGTAYLCFRVQRRTRPTAGPSSVGVGTPFAYALTGRLWRLWELPVSVRLGALWSGMALLMLLLGINKQLDLQTALTETGRLLARYQGWYERRHDIQLKFILGVMAFGVYLFAAVVALARGAFWRVWPMLVGTVFLICFVAIRAASFHHIDLLIHRDWKGLKLNWVLELSGIGLVAYGAWRAGAGEAAPAVPGVADG